MSTHSFPCMSICKNFFWLVFIDTRDDTYIHYFCRTVSKEINIPLLITSPIGRIIFSRKAILLEKLITYSFDYFFFSGDDILPTSGLSALYSATVCPGERRVPSDNVHSKLSAWGDPPVSVTVTLTDSWSADSVINPVNVPGTGAAENTEWHVC